MGARVSQAKGHTLFSSLWRLLGGLGCGEIWGEKGGKIGGMVGNLGY
jgi:hypothetical protein